MVPGQHHSLTSSKIIAEKKETFSTRTSLDRTTKQEKLIFLLNMEDNI